MTLCAAGCRCCAFDSTTKTSAVTDGCPLCSACLLVGERDIRGLRLDYGDLEQLLPRGSGAMSTRVGGSSDPGTPLSLAVDALQRDIAWTLAAWEPPVREAAGLADERVRGVRPGWAVATAVQVIAARVEVLAGLPPIWGYADGLASGPVLRDGLDAVTALRSLHRNARAVLGLTRLVHRLPGECSRCGVEALERENGVDTVRCAHCDERWTYDDYRRYVGMMLVAVEPR